MTFSPPCPWCKQPGVIIAVSLANRPGFSCYNWDCGSRQRGLVPVQSPICAELERLQARVEELEHPALDATPLEVRNEPAK
jgi:hypothetical protein